MKNLTKMKNVTIQYKTLIVSILFLLSTKLSAYQIVVHRERGNNTTGSYSSVTGYNQPVVDAGGNVMWIDQYIKCWGDGAEECPNIILKAAGGNPQLDVAVDNPLIESALIEYCDLAALSIDNGTINGGASKTLCIQGVNEVNTCYIISVNWTSTVNGDGKRSDVITLNFNQINPPAFGN